MKKKSLVLQVVVFLLAAAGLVWFLIPLGWHVLNPGNGLGIVVCLILMAGALFFQKIRAASQKSKPIRCVFRTIAVLFVLGALWSAAMTVCMISTAASTPPENSTVIVLGSMVKGNAPSADLWSRIDAAAVYLKSHPNAKCIASGGQGYGESVSEASAIKNGLVSEGIDASRILMESTSKTTEENFRNSLKLIDQKGLYHTLAVVTDDYHEFRACSIARSLHVMPYAVPAKTPWYIFSSCWSREVLAITKYFVMG